MAGLKNPKKVIDEILDALPWVQRQKVIDAGKKFKKETREKLTTEVVERLFLQLVKEAKDRGKK